MRGNCEETVKKTIPIAIQLVPTETNVTHSRSQLKMKRTNCSNCKQVLKWRVNPNFGLPPTKIET